jgi:hypothetical protein
LLVATHDLSAIRTGVVRRTVRTAAEVIEQARVDLVHGCISCTLREDVLPTLVRLASQRPDSDIVLVLPPVVEPEAVASACAHCLVDGAPVTEVAFGHTPARVGGPAGVVDAVTAVDEAGAARGGAGRPSRTATAPSATTMPVAVRRRPHSPEPAQWLPTPVMTRTAGPAPGSG